MFKNIIKRGSIISIGIILGALLGLVLYFLIGFIAGDKRFIFPNNLLGLVGYFFGALVLWALFDSHRESYIEAYIHQSGRLLIDGNVTITLLGGLVGGFLSLAKFYNEIVRHDSAIFSESTDIWYYSGLILALVGIVGIIVIAKRMATLKDVFC